MPCRKTSPMCVLVAAAMLVTGTGCGGRAAKPGQEHPLLGLEVPVVSQSIIDSENLYLSTVRVTATIPRPGTGTIEKRCSGVLVDERLVLTAGHCVCDERKPVAPEAPDTTIVEKGALCARTVTVQVFTYRASPGLSNQDESVPGDESEPYLGRVQVHEKLRIAYRKMETEPGVMSNVTVYSNADIAAVLLKNPIREQVKYVPLAKTGVGRNDRVILVGYGLPYLGGQMGLHRRYGENHVVALKADGTTFQVGKQDVKVSGTYSGEAPFAQVDSGSYLTAGDSGGPCFRKQEEGLEVVGIAKSVRAGTLTLSAYTSVFSYLDWLNQQLVESRKS